jgi:hypothetical protein
VDQLDHPLLAPAQEMPRRELRSIVTANRSTECRQSALRMQLVRVEMDF